MSWHQYANEGMKKEVKKPPVMMRDWLVYHFVRNKPIYEITLQRDEVVKMEKIALTFSAVGHSLWVYTYLIPLLDPRPHSEATALWSPHPIHVHVC